MIKKLRNFEDRFSIPKAALIIGFLTLLAKFLAIYRERLFSSTFGQDRMLDAYFSAFRIPDFMTNLLILSTLSVAFLPVFTQLLAENKAKAMQAANIILNSAVLGIAAIALILLAVSEPLTRRLIPGFSAEHFRITLNLTRLFLISPVLFAASTIFGGFLNANKKFLAASFAPILYNLGIIAGVIYFYPRFGIMGLGYGVIVGAAAQLLIQLLFAARSGFYWLPKIDLSQPSIKKVARLYMPRILAFDLSNITLLLGTILGSHLIEGSITALNQAYNLQAVPIGIFAYSLALAGFTPLSEHYALKDEKKFILTLLNILKQILFFIIPITILMLLFRAYIVRLILGFGKFTWEDTIRTFTVLGIFSLSLFSQSLTTILSRAFFARQNTKTPVAINLISLGINLALGIILGKKFGINGLASAFVIASVINALLLFAMLRMSLAKALAAGSLNLAKEFDNQLAQTTGKILLSSLLMGAAGYGAIYLIAPLVNTHSVIGIALQAGLAGTLAAAVYLITGSFLKLKESEMALDFLKKFLLGVRDAIKVAVN